MRSRSGLQCSYFGVLLLLIICREVRSATLTLTPVATYCIDDSNGDNTPDDIALDLPLIGLGPATQPGSTVAFHVYDLSALAGSPIVSARIQGPLIPNNSPLTDLERLIDLLAFPSDGVPSLDEFAIPG